MINDKHEYMTTAEAARDLELSIATVQNLVKVGELNALRTQGGHRRIFVDSVRKYRERYGYPFPLKKKFNKVCVLHQGDNFDLMFSEVNDPKLVKVMSHPLDLLNIDDTFDILFIDANNQWLKSISSSLVDALQSKFTIFIYSSDALPEDSYLRGLSAVFKIPYKINSQFISGYIAGLNTV